MSESCLVISPPARNEGMQRESGMGINSRGAVSDIGTVLDPDTSLRRKRSVNNSSTGVKQGKGTKMAIANDDQGHSMKGPQEWTSNSREKGIGESSVPMQNPQSSEKDEDEGTQGRSGTSSDNNPSLPQHKQIQSVEPLDISYCATPATLRLKDVLVSRLDAAVLTGRIQVIDLSRRGLVYGDAELIRASLRNNPQLAVLKLGYNNLGDKGASIIASSCSIDGRHHQRLTVLDLGFNGIGDEGCTNLSLHMLAGNYTLRNLYLSGNHIKKKGAMALAGAILHGCSLAKLHLSANELGPSGLKVLSGAIAEMDARRQHILQRQGGIIIAAVKPQAIEHLLLDNTAMRRQGLVTLSSMLVSNQSITVLGLSNNGIDDHDMALLSQALAQNKNIPLSAIHLSFNKITCVGVECFMNAIWGSKTLKEIKLDNNKMQDRGAQLCSVVLGAVPLEVLDISFNRVSTVGIKALMKSVSENDSLQLLSLSGMPMDQNASKAISYALAYNQSLQRFHIDSCCIGYSGQRHIVAGIVSNRNVKLRSFTGFPLGPITKTLGLPQVPEDWGNDRVLSFVRFMWAYSKVGGEHHNPSRGPAPPSAVAASGKKAFAGLSSSDSCKLQFQHEHASAQSEDSPIVAPETAILVRSESGQNLQIPAWGDDLLGDEDSWSDSESFDRSSVSDSNLSINRSNSVSNVDPERRNKNLQWLRAHLHSLNEVGNLVFNNADLWQLHQYFFSPAYALNDEVESVGSYEVAVSGEDVTKSHILDGTRDTSSLNASNLTVFQSGRFTSGSKAMHSEVTNSSKDSFVELSSRPNKRGSLEEALQDAEPCAKRAKNLKPRIAYYPRIREKLESLGTKPSAQTLSLLRQLKYIESVMLQGKNVYTDDPVEHKQPDASDVEMILLDLL